MSVTEKLKAPFDPRVIHWRVGGGGTALAYIDARDVMKRLDDVCGDLWQVEYPFEGCCRIGIKIDDEWVWRSNGAGETKIEGEKGQYSDAFKRAAAVWGIGRYLYYLPKYRSQGGQINQQELTKQLPKWALPKEEG